MNRNEQILSDADRCVFCGMCLPHCPTYALSHNEAESPRGRIGLIQALASGRLSADTDLVAHLDHCLVCRACERVCPSRVPYARLIGQVRGELRSQRGRYRGELPARALTGKTRQLLFSAARLYQGSMLQTVVRRYHLLGKGALARLDGLLPPLHRSPQLQSRFPAHGDCRGTVALFSGCTGPELDRDALDSAIRVLQAFGFEVLIPQQQTCCGAMHHHRGDSASFQRLASANLEAFEPLLNKVEAIVHIASGCGAMLHDYASWVAHPLAEVFAAKQREICAFLSEQTWPTHLKLTPLHGTAVTHTPCSVRNVLGGGAAPDQLLRSIPQLQVLPLADDGHCCGAAGRYMLDHPHTAEILREPKLAALASSQADYLVSTNIGCALHLRAGLTPAERPQVLHPVTLLARQLPPPSRLPPL